MVERYQYDLPRAEQLLVPSALVAGAFDLLTNPRDLRSMGKGLGTALAEKRIQLWFADRRLEGLARSLAWDGALDPGTGDFLFVVDDKRVPNKVDYYSSVHTDYHLTLSPSGQGAARTHVELVNDTPPGLNHFVVGNLRPYALNIAMMNVYVPRRVTDAHSAHHPLRFFHGKPKGFLKHVEGSTWVLTKHVEAYPGHPGSTTFTYTIPGAATCRPDGSFAYRLRVGHQPMRSPSTLSVTIRLPSGSTVERRIPNWTVRGDVVSFHTTLTRDVNALLVYRTPNGCS